jgi:hypothetical protein
MLKHVAVWIFSFTTLISFIDTYQRVVWEYTVGLNILGHIIAFTGVIAMIFFHVKWYHDVTPKNPYTLDLDLMIKLEEENQVKRDKETSEAKAAKIDKKFGKKIDDLAKNSIRLEKLKIIGPSLPKLECSPPENKYSLEEKERSPEQQSPLPPWSQAAKSQLLKINEEPGMESGSTINPANNLFIRGLSLSPSGYGSTAYNRPSTDSLNDMNSLNQKPKDRNLANYQGKVCCSKISRRQQKESHGRPC